MTGNLTSLYDQIFNSTLTAAYQHGERLTLRCFFNRNLGLYILTLVFLCLFASDEAEIQSTFSWTCCTASPESCGRRPPRPCLKVGGKHISPFQVCFRYLHPRMSENSFGIWKTFSNQPANWRVISSVFLSISIVLSWKDANITFLGMNMRLACPQNLWNESIRVKNKFTSPVMSHLR